MSTVESRQFEDGLPGFLFAGPGRALMNTIALVFDSFTASLDDVRTGLIGASPPYDAVPEIAKDRVMFRGFYEPIAQFVGRASVYRQFWKAGGSSIAALRAVAGVWGPDAPRMRIVRNFGWVAPPHVAKSRWTTREPDGSIVEHIADPANFNWDGNNVPHRAFLIIYADKLVTTDEGTFGDGSSLYGDNGTRFDGVHDKRTIGTDAFSEYVQRTRASLDAIKPASVIFPNIIIAFDPASFDPTAAPGDPGLPDGTWGRDMKLVAGRGVRARLQTARYWKGV